MDIILETTNTALKKKGLSDAAASQLAVGHPALIKKLRLPAKGDKRYNYVNLQKLAEVLDLELYFGPRREPRPTWDHFTDRLLPRRGIASCGINGWGKNQPLGDPLPAPEPLKDTSAFYVSASGQSMIPEGINSGMFCLVSPARTALSGDRIWIKDTKGGAAIKRLIQIDDDRLHLRGWQPRQDGRQQSVDEERFLNFVAEYHPVVAVYEGTPGDKAARLISDPRPPLHTDDTVQVRLHNQQHGALEEDGVMSWAAFPAPWLGQLGLSEQSAALVWVNGDCMEPTLKSGAMAMLNTRVGHVKKRKIYAFRYGEDLFIKRLERIGPDTLIAFSDNEAYDTMVIARDSLEQFQILEEVIWSGHRVGHLR